jgi:hypothetical protein
VIGSEFFKGQGLGNQLWVYASVRCISLRNGYDFGFLCTENFKGSAFLALEMSSQQDQKIDASRFTAKYSERVVRHPRNEADISPWDPDLQGVADGTLVYGTMQAERYLAGFKDEIADWFSTPGEFFDGCVISLRGGEYKNLKEVFLPKSYYEQAISRIREIDPETKFVVVTDDAGLARDYFPDFPVISSGGVKRLWRWYFHPKSDRIGRDFSAIQHAKYLILSNSSFSWWGAYTNKRVRHVVAPKYWARFNISNGYWSNGDSLTEGWEWLDREGRFSSYADCQAELENFRKNPSF